MKATNIDLEIQENLDSFQLTEKHKVTVEMVASFVQQLLNFLPRAIPDYTDHGVQHSNNLMNSFSNFLTNLKNSTAAQLTEKEKWLICLTIWLHDIGVLITQQPKKKEHNDNSVKLLERSEFAFLRGMLGDDIVQCLKFVIKYHSSHENMDDIPKDVVCADIRLRLCCAIFRLLDGCDITSKRTHPILYKLLKAYHLIDPDNAKYWEAHLGISSAVFQKNKIVIDCNRRTNHALLTNHLSGDLKNINTILKEEAFPEFDLAIVHSSLKK